MAGPDRGDGAVATVGWGQGDAEGPGGETVTQAVPGPRMWGDRRDVTGQRDKDRTASRSRGTVPRNPLTFGWEPSAMVEREKLSLCSSDGVRYLPGGRGEHGGETGGAAEHPAHP